MKTFFRNFRKITWVGLVWLLVPLLAGLVSELPVELPVTQAAGPVFVKATGDQLTLNGQPITLKGSSFFPLGHAYATMWDNWDPDLVRSGLAQAKALGNNVVRVMVLYDPVFGWTKAGRWLCSTGIP